MPYGKSGKGKMYGRTRRSTRRPQISKKGLTKKETTQVKTIAKKAVNSLAETKYLKRMRVSIVLSQIQFGDIRMGLERFSHLISVVCPRLSLSPGGSRGKSDARWVVRESWRPLRSSGPRLESLLDNSACTW